MASPEESSVAVPPLGTARNVPYGQIIGWIMSAVVALLLTLLGWVANDMQDSIEKLEDKREKLP